MSARTRRAPRSARRLALLALASTVSACWTPAIRTIPDSRSPYDVLSSSATKRLALARADLDAGLEESARTALATLASEIPTNIAVGIWLQEAEIAAETKGLDAGGTAAVAERLRERYRKRAEEDPTVSNLVLAARLEPDPLAAEVILDRGESLDSRCAWCPYGLAWLSARAGDWAKVRDRVARAKALDPGHMPTLWLDTWLKARGGRVAEAITSFDTWIEKAREDPRVDRRLVLAAEVDRALLSVLDGDPKRARKILSELEQEEEESDLARRHLVEAVAEQALGNSEAALASAREAEAAGGGGILPAVQQALLHEVWLGNPSAAEADWARALELSRNDPGLGSMLERMRARVRIERFAAARAAGAGEGAAQGAKGKARGQDG